MKNLQRYGTTEQLDNITEKTLNAIYCSLNALLL
jgi:hypothetical protein